jgi:TolB protein
MDADGTNPSLLTEFTYGEQAYRASPDWAPDGRRIAYESRIDGSFQIMTIDMRDRSTKQYTSDGQNEDPSWSPDSRHMVFSSTRTGPRQLWVLDAESGRMRQLTHAAGARLAAWSPVLKP